MESFKKELFRKEYNTAFPCYEELEGKECLIIRSNIISKYHVQEEDFDNNLNKKQIFFDRLNAEDENFNLLNLIKELNLKIDSMIYVTWNSFVDIDKFPIESFCKYFNDIWYPIADDIDISSQDLSWIISIRHNGAIYYIEL